eukprot:2625121-Amphidinium_carterae.2
MGPRTPERTLFRSAKVAGKIFARGSTRKEQPEVGTSRHGFSKGAIQGKIWVSCYHEPLCPDHIIYSE